MPSNRPKIEPKLQRRAQQQSRRRKEKKICCRILIVCEGEKTEPEYFNGFKTISNNSFVYNIEAHGHALNTIGVVEKAIELKTKAEKSGVPYDAVWAVFDKDDFPASNFNSAISMADANGVDVAWSNEAFELWFLLHFNHRDTPMSREDYKKAISDAVNSKIGKKSKKYSYKKEDPDNYKIINQYGNVENAIRNARTLHSSISGKQYHSYNPCTTVYLLVLQLLNRDEELIKRVMKTMGND